ncbi:MAG: T9SS type A sorting domain-containing protein [Salinivirgaceae bacterium]|nr:T9SS type A sorting domain-containing protein [Salinivirgaceae bacterium]
MESNTYVSNNVLHTDEPSSVYIFNAGGILVKTENNTTSVDLSDLKKGVYIAKVNGAPIKFVR